MADEIAPVDVDALRATIIDMAVESWRFSRLFERLLGRLDAGDQGRYRNQFRWFLKRIEESLETVGLRLVNVEGHPFDPGMAATPLNIEEFAADDRLLVDQMIEPIIMGTEGIVRPGTVILMRAQA